MVVSWARAIMSIFKKVWTFPARPYYYILLFPKINRKLNNSKIEGRKGHTGPLGQPWGEELPCRFLSRPGGSQQVLMCVWCWGPFVNTNWYFGIFANWFWHLTTINKHLFGTLYWSPSERVYDRSVLWCVSVYSICMKWKLTFSSPVATAEFSKFAGILSAALSQHHLLGFEIAQLEFHHLY